VLGVASGYFHALAIRSNGTVAAWGTTANGATNVPADLSDVVSVAGGNYFSVALKSDGTVVAWGLGTSGQTNVPAGLSSVTAISAGGSHALALRANGTVVAWGLNSSGQTNVPAGLSNVVALAAGSIHSLALKNDGTIIGWGGFGKIPNYTNVVALAAGFGQSLALQADGTVLAWSTGGAATGLPAGISNVVAISAGGGLQGWFHSVALKADGTMVAWGNNNVGQVNAPGEVTSAVTISAGGGSTLAYLNDRSPFVATQPLNRHAVSGTNITLAALSAGQPALNFQWRLNGADIPGAINPVLVLTNVNRNSRGYYSALVWNALGTTNSRDAWLDVVGPVRLLPSASGPSGGLLNFVATDSLGGSLAAEDSAWLETQASTNLLNWQPISSALVFTNGMLLLQDPAQTNYPARFYRLIEH
jgi:alpha-tubulin suppressor-like RCC1 family protein